MYKSPNPLSADARGQLSETLNGRLTDGLSVVGVAANFGRPLAAPPRPKSGTCPQPDRHRWAGDLNRISVSIMRSNTVLDPADRFQAACQRSRLDRPTDHGRFLAPTAPSSPRGSDVAPWAGLHGSEFVADNTIEGACRYDF